MKKILEYTKNIASSVAFSTSDIIRDDAPAMFDAVAKNSEVFRDIIYDIKDHRQLFNRVNERMKSHNIYKTAAEGKKAIFEDIKSGKFYNRQRDELFANRSFGMENDGGYNSDDDFDFDKEFDLDGNFDDDIDEPKVDRRPTQGDHMVSDSIIHSSITNANSIAKTLVATSEYAVENSKVQYRDQIIRNQKANFMLQGALGNINKQLDFVAKNSIDIMQTHAQNSKSFYEKTVAFQTDMLGYMKEVVEMQRDMYKARQPEQKKDKEDRRTYYDDVIQASGVTDLKKYVKSIGDNINAKLEDVTQLATMFSDNDDPNANPYLHMVSSPLKFIPRAVANKMIGKDLRKAMGKLDTSVGGSFATSMAMLNSIANDEENNPLVKTLAGLLVPRINKAKEKSVADYHKGDMAWNGKAQKALTEVIPTLLAKQLSAMTGSAEMRFDFDRGQWINTVNLSKELSSMKENVINRTFSDIQSEIKDRVDQLIVMNFDEQQSFREDMKNYFSYFFDRGELISPRKFKKNRLPDLEISDDNYDLITSMIKYVDPHKLMKANQEMFSNKGQYAKDKARQEDIYDALLNNTKLNEHLKIQKDGFGDDVITGVMNKMSLGETKDAYNKTIFDYLRDIRNVMLEGIVTYPAFGMPMGDMGMSPIRGGGSVLNIGGLDRRSMLSETRKVLSFDDQRRKDISKQRSSVDKENKRRIDQYERAKKRAKERNSKNWQDMDLVDYGGVVSDNSENFYKATYYQNLNINAKRKLQEDREWDDEHGRPLFSGLLDDENEDGTFSDNTESKLERKRKVAEIEQKALENAREKDRKIYPWMKKKEDGQYDLSNDEAGKKIGFLDGLIAADGIVDKFTYTSDKMSEVLSKPTETITKMLSKVDKRIYEFFYGGEEVNYQGEKVRGYMDMMVVSIRNTFEKLNDKINDYFLTPLRERLEDWGVFEKVDEWKGKAKDKADEFMTHLFGEKDAKGWRHGGVMGDFTKQIGEDTRGMFSWFVGDKKEKEIDYSDIVNQGLETAGFGLTPSRTQELKSKFVDNSQNYDDYLKELDTLTKESREISQRIKKLESEKESNNKSLSAWLSEVNKSKQSGDKRKTAQASSGYKKRVDYYKNRNKAIDIEITRLKDRLLAIEQRRKQIGSYRRTSGTFSIRKEKEKMYNDLFGTSGAMTSFDELDKQSSSALLQQLHYVQEQNDIRSKFKDNENNQSVFGNMQANPAIFMKGMMAKVSDMVNLLQIIDTRLSHHPAMAKFVSKFTPTSPDRLDLSSEGGLNTQKVLSNATNFNTWAKDRSGNLRERTNYGDYQSLMKLFDDADDREAEKLNALGIAKSNLGSINPLQYTRDKWRTILQKRGISAPNLDSIITQDNYQDPRNIPAIRKLIHDGKIKNKQGPIQANAFSGGVFGKLTDDDYDFLPMNLLDKEQAKRITKNVPYINNHSKDAQDRITNQLLGAEKIPAFAAQGVVSEPTVATLGEDGTEVVLSLKRLRYIEGTNRMYDTLSMAFGEMYKRGQLTREQFNKAIKDIDTARRKAKKAIPTAKDPNLKNFSFDNNIIRKTLREQMGVIQEPYAYESDNKNLYNIKTKVFDAFYKTMDFDNLDDLKNKASNKFGKGLDKAHEWDKENYGERGLFGAIKREMADEISTAVSAFTGIEQGKEEEFKKNLKLNSRKVYDEVLDHLPEGVSGALIGGAIGLIPGVIGGPLLGAAVGASVNIIKNSETLQNKLFGTKDAKGNRADDGMIPAELVRTFNKYAPDTLKLGVGGALMSILPFVPGGPITGLLAGSAIAFAKNNEGAQKFLFGDGIDDNGLFSKKSQETFKKALPKTLGGAAIGAIGSFIGPFGLVGGTLLGGTLGALSTNDTVREMIFGKWDPVTKKRENGLIPIVGEAITSPFKKMISGMKDGFKEFFDKKIKNPFLYALQPFGKELKLVGKKLGNYVKGLFDETIGGPIKRFMTKFLFKPLGALIKGVVSTPINLFGAVTNGVLGALGLSSKSLRAKHIRQGDADYMTAEERETFRVRNNKYFRPGLTSKGGILKTLFGVIGGGAINPALGLGLGVMGSTQGVLHGRDKFHRYDKNMMEFTEKMSEDEYYELQSEIEQAKAEAAQGIDPRYSANKYPWLRKLLGPNFMQSDAQRSIAGKAQRTRQGIRDQFKVNVEDKRTRITKEMETEREKLKQNSLTKFWQNRDKRGFDEIEARYHAMKNEYERGLVDLKSPMDRAEWFNTFDQVEKLYLKTKNKMDKAIEKGEANFIKRYRKQFNVLDTEEEKFRESELRYTKGIKNSFGNSQALKGMEYLLSESNTFAKQRGFKTYAEYKKEMDAKKLPKDGATLVAEEGNEIAKEQTSIQNQILESLEAQRDFMVHGKDGAKFKALEEKTAKSNVVNLQSKNGVPDTGTTIGQETLDLQTKRHQEILNGGSYYDPNKMTEEELTKYSKGSYDAESKTITIFTDEGIPIKYDKDSSGEWRPIQDKNFKQWGKLKSMITGISESAFGKATTNIKDKVTHGLGFVGNLLKGVGPFLGKMLLGTLGVKAAKTIWSKWLGNTGFGKNMEWIWNNPAEAAGKAGDKFGEIWTSHIKPFLTEKLPTFLDKIKEGILGIGQKIIENMPIILQNMWDIMVANKEHLLDFLKIYTGWKVAKWGVGAATGYGTSLISTGAGAAGGFLVGKAKDGVKGAWKGIKGLFGKKVAEEATETVAEGALKKTGEKIIIEGVEEATGKGAEQVTKKAADKVLNESMQEATKGAAKVGAKEVLEEGAEVTAKNISKKGIRTAVEGSRGKLVTWFVGLLDPVIESILKVVKKFMPNFGQKGLSAFIKNTFSSCHKYFSNTKIAAKIAEKSGRDVAGIATGGIVNLVFMVGFGAWGASKTGAAKWFGVPKEDVDAKMQAISGVMQFLLQAPAVWILEIVNLVTTSFLGYNFLQKLAVWLYDAWNGELDITEDSRTMAQLQNKYLDKVPSVPKSQTKRELADSYIIEDGDSTVVGMGGKSNSSKQYLTGGGFGNSKFKFINPRTSSNSKQYLTGGGFGNNKGKPANRTSNSRRISTTPKGTPISQNTDYWKKYTEYQQSLAPDYYQKTNAHNEELRKALEQQTGVDAIYNRWRGYEEYLDGKATTVGENVSFNNQLRLLNGFPYWSQNDPQWKDLYYAQNYTYGDAACGPTAMSMITSAFNNKPISPLDLTDMGLRYWIDNAGTAHDMFSSSSNPQLSDYNVKGQNISNTWDSLKANIEAGRPVVINGQGNISTTPYTPGGHYSVVTGMASDNSVWVNDPMGEGESTEFSKDALFKNGTTKSMWAYTDINGKNLRLTDRAGFANVPTIAEGGNKESGLFDWMGKMASGIGLFGDAIMGVVGTKYGFETHENILSKIANWTRENGGTQMPTGLAASFANAIGGYTNINSTAVNTSNLAQMPAGMGFVRRRGGGFGSLSGADLQNKFFTGAYANKPLKKHANDLANAANKFGVNPLFLSSLVALESGWGTSALAKNKNNFSGYAAYDSSPYKSARTFDSPAQNFDETARLLKNNYLTPGGKYYIDGSLGGVNKYYASDPKWSGTISDIMASRVKNFDPNAQIGGFGNAKKSGRFGGFGKTSPVIKSAFELADESRKLDAMDNPNSFEFMDADMSSVAELSMRDRENIMKSNFGGQNINTTINAGTIDANLIELLTRIVMSVSNIGRTNELLQDILNLITKKLNINITENDIKELTKKSSSGNSINPNALLNIINEKGGKGGTGDNSLTALIAAMLPLTQ
jgi:hypothetical protein